MRKALLTGGAGFIGSHLAEALLARGYDVTVLDNESTGSREYIPEGARFVSGDIREKESFERAAANGVDLVLHAAAQASMIKSFHDPLADIDTNITGTLNVLDFCLKKRVPRLLYASSMSCYGNSLRLPAGEQDLCRPISYYGITKYAAECFIHSTAARNDLDFELNVTSFRMFNVYGERQSLDNPYQGVMAIFISNVLNETPIMIDGDGQQSRDFIYVGDVVDAWISSIDAPQSFGEVINLGTGVSLSIAGLADHVLKALGRDRSNFPCCFGPERLGNQKQMRADISRAKAILGWSPKVDIEEGLARTTNWAVSTLHREPPSVARA